MKETICRDCNMVLEKDIGLDRAIDAINVEILNKHSDEKHHGLPFNYAVILRQDNTN